ncbi:hypothetical protein GCM10009716_24540 [Streptomyces sodiiphilus]|uniref:Uncharacterized protein n=1 Tax=Streptomyces sodiiphilus TaxID=226217 RepID=A0ABP5AJN5_9ACTN
MAGPYMEQAAGRGGSLRFSHREGLCFLIGQALDRDGSPGRGPTFSVVLTDPNPAERTFPVTSLVRVRGWWVGGKVRAQQS